MLNSLLYRGAHFKQQYQKKTPRQHILDAPDTYIGSVEQSEQNAFVINNDGDAIRLVETDEVVDLY